MDKNEKKFNEWVNECQMVIDKYFQRTFPTLSIPQLEVNKGKKFYKIVKVDNQKCVWAFVDIKTLDILKPACWSRPAKHARGNVLDDSNGLGNLDAYGPRYMK